MSRCGCISIMSEVEWSNALTVALIEELKVHECLWNKRLRIYRDNNARGVAKQKMVVTLQEYVPYINWAQIERKIRTLRQNFNRQRRKVQESCRSGAGADEVHRSSWWCYEMLAFLAAGEMEAATTSNLSQQSCANLVSAIFSRIVHTIP